MRTKNLHNQLVDWRHDLHMNPQISFEEIYASSKVANLLKEFGIVQIKKFSNQQRKNLLTIKENILLH